jgi:putative membrane protein
MTTTIMSHFEGGYGPGKCFTDWFGAGHGMGGFGGIMMIVMWVLFIVGIVFLIRWLAASTKAASAGHPAHESPLDILKKRYARGEIDKEEFENKKKDIG